MLEFIRSDGGRAKDRTWDPYDVNAGGNSKNLYGTYGIRCLSYVGLCGTDGKRCGNISRLACKLRASFFKQPVYNPEVGGAF